MRKYNQTRKMVTASGSVHFLTFLLSKKKKFKDANKAIGNIISYITF